VANGQNLNGQTLISAINVTPLVDVVLVLLVILMVTAGYLVSRAIPVDLPAGATGETTASTLAISIDASGQRFLDGVPVAQARLREELRRARLADPSVRAVIAADGAVAHREVIGLVDLLRKEGLYQFAFNIRPEDLKEP
jgi:biopolymer transport protein ExbD